MNKHHDLSDLKFEDGFLVIAIDGETKRFQLKKISPVLEKASDEERNNFEISPCQQSRRLEDSGFAERPCCFYEKVKTTKEGNPNFLSLALLSFNRPDIASVRGVSQIKNRADFLYQQCQGAGKINYLG